MVKKYIFSVKKYQFHVMKYSNKFVHEGFPTSICAIVKGHKTK